MFDLSINSQAIKLFKGDDSPAIILKLDQGTWDCPIQYKLYPGISIAYEPENLLVEVNEATFYSQIITDGFFDFEYVNGNWKYLGATVTLATYGISYTGTPIEHDHIIIAQFKTNPAEIQFYILNAYDDVDNYLVKKIFKTTGQTTTSFKDNKYPSVTTTKENVDENNNGVIKFDPVDTQYLPTGDYCYLIKLKLYDGQINTIVKRNPFIVR